MTTSSTFPSGIGEDHPVWWVTVGEPLCLSQSSGKSHDHLWGKFPSPRQSLFGRCGDMGVTVCLVGSRRHCLYMYVSVRELVRERGRE